MVLEVLQIPHRAGGKNEEMSLIKTYNWWRHVGHNCSRMKSLYLVWYCDIKPFLLIPYYNLSMKYHHYMIRGIKKRMKKKYGVDLFQAPTEQEKQ